MRKEYSSRFIFSIFAAMAVLLLWALGVNAAHADTTPPQLSIAGNGQTIVKRATVVSVSGTKIVAETRWGAATLRWTIETTGSTKFYPDGQSREILQEIKKGDSISFSGLLNDSLAQPTVRASVVRDHTLLEKDEAPQITPPEIPDTGSVSEVDTTSSTTDENDSLLVAATSTGLLGWLWRFLYGDPSTMSMQ